ncbi:MAG: T9SS type A sorting domain-containing protein [Fibrobacterota bacterium]
MTLKSCPSFFLLLLSAILVFFPCRATAQAGFTSGPSVVVNGNTAQIDFTVSTATDVAVWIEDNDGNIIRHLAAGLLGSSSVAPPLQSGLSQSIAWDGKNDRGEDVAASLTKTVKVSLGLNVAFDKVMGWNGLSIGAVMGLAVDSSGHLYVLNCGGDYIMRSSPQVQVLDRSGSYVKTILPCPANVTQNTALQNIWRNSTVSGWIPRVHHFFSSFYPEIEATNLQTICVMNNRLIFTNAGISTAERRILRLLQLNLDGSIPDYGFFSTPITSAKMNYANVHLAAYPDSGWIYSTGLVGPGEWDYTHRQAVYRSRLDNAGPGTLFAGEEYVAGTDNAHFDTTKGLGVDGQGNVYVADRGNNRVIVFNKSGQYVAQFSVTRPGPISVQANGILYVISSGGGTGAMLYKYDSYSASSASAQLALLTTGAPSIAMDTHAASPIVWVGFSEVATAGGKGELWRVTDSAGTLNKQIITSFTENELVRPMYIAADDTRDEVYVKDWAGARVLRYSGASGAQEVLPLTTAGDIAVGPDGNLFAFCAVNGGYRGGGYVKKYSHDMTPLSFSSGGDSLWVIGGIRGGHLRGTRGLDITPRGDIYVLHFTGYQDLDATWSNVHLRVYDSTGTVQHDSLIDWIGSGGGAGGIRVDKGSNIYVTDHVMPDTMNQYTGLTEVERTEWSALVTNIATYNCYRHVWGSLLKFPATGGAVTHTGSKTYPTTPGLVGWTETFNGKEYALINDVSLLYPVSPVPVGPKGGGCTCWTPRFDLDGFGRIFLPDLAHFRVTVLDNAINKICNFGGYGNADSRGPGSLIETPAIGIAWPAGVAVTDKAIYVSDMVNRRIVRNTISYATHWDTLLAQGTQSEVAAECAGFRVTASPNPCAISAMIKYTLPEKCLVNLAVFNVRGEKVAALVHKTESGKKQVVWNTKNIAGKEVPSGVYYYQITAGSFKIVKPIILIR